MATTVSYGLRETYYGLTVKADQALADQAKDIFFQELPATANVSGVNPVLLYQGITLPQIKAMTKNGGNPLGLSASDGPLYEIHVACSWKSEADDATIYTFVTKVLNRIKAAATSINKQNDYLYMNYASLYEDVIRSYGADNKAKLKSIAAKYGPSRCSRSCSWGISSLIGLRSCSRRTLRDDGQFAGFMTCILVVGLASLVA